MKRSKEGPVTPADVLALAHRYQVSFAAMMLRLEELRLISLGSWDRLRDAGFKPNEARRLLDLGPLTQGQTTTSISLRGARRASIHLGEALAGAAGDDVTPGPSQCP